MRVLVTVIALLITPAAISGTGVTTAPTAPPDEASAPLVTISISGLTFDPADIIIAPGTRVRWLNIDPVDHDITSGVSINGRKARGLKQTRFPDGKFSSGLFGKQKTFEHVFQRAGDYPYYCSVHPFMTATITVKQGKTGR